MDRTTLLLSFLDKSMSIAEIGPSYHPIAPKAAGWATTVVDYTDRAGLLALYGSHAVSAARIEDVDVVWSEGTLSKAFPESLRGTFDVVVASHVIEHCPDIVRFLSSCHDLIKPEGFVLLVVPDKRECFDYFKPVSNSSDALEAFDQHRTRHTRRNLFLHIGWAVATDDGIAWRDLAPTGLRLVHRLHQAKVAFDTTGDGPDAAYSDCHGWFFTPSSFELLILDLNAMGLAHLDIAFLSPSLGSEFVAVLRPSRGDVLDAEALAQLRLGLMKRHLVETRDQIDRMLMADGLAKSAGPA